MVNNDIENLKDIPKESVEDQIKIKEIVRNSHKNAQEAYSHSIAKDPFLRVKLFHRP